jgi:hypothetical protein
MPPLHTSLVLAFGALALAACGSDGRGDAAQSSGSESSTGPTNPTGPTVPGDVSSLEAASLSVATAYCANIERCCGTTAPSCIENRAALLEAQVEAELAAMGGTFEPACAELALELLQEAEGCSWESITGAGPIKGDGTKDFCELGTCGSFGSFAVGPSGRGDACKNADDCGFGLTCFASICQPVCGAELGEACGAGVSGCRSPLACTDPNGGTCALIELPDGADCYDPFQCASRRCDYGVCGPGPGLGESCSAGYVPPFNCAEGLVCSTEGRCSNYAQAGESCDPPCAAGLVCGEGYVCVPEAEQACSALGSSN